MQVEKTVLVIDDEAHIRRVIEMKLKLGGYRVLTATNGEQGLERIRADRPDAVIVDLNMPKMDGKTMCHMAEPLKAEQPFLTIVVTARISPDEERWISQLTDTMLREKPFSPSRMLECVDNYFGIER